MSIESQIVELGMPGFLGAAWRRRVKNLALNLLTALAIALWVFVLRPGSLGGPATYIVVSGTSMQPTMHTGDLVLSLKQDSYRKGDVITYAVPEGEDGEGTLVIHRIIGGNERTGFITQGDNRDGADLWRPKPEDIKGKRALLVPRGGQFLQLLRTPAALGVLAGLFAFIAVLVPPDEKEQRKREERKARRALKKNREQPA